MKQTFLFLALFSLIASTAYAQNSATFEIWRDADLFKLSTNTTDSVTYTKVGSLLTITCEVREPFAPRTTRRLQITIPNFTGIGQYDPSTGASTYWENFTQTKSCNCFDAAINDVNITRYDSVRKEIGGTFNWKCQSFSNGSGEQINYRVRNGVFDVGAEKVKIELVPKDSIVVGELQNDTTLLVTVTAKKGTTPLAGVKIFISDKTSDASANYPEKGVTDANGAFAYTINFRKATPPGEYLVQVYGTKDDMRGSDTAKTTVYYGNRYWHYKCAGISVLEFDAGEGKEWKPETEGSATLKTTGTITVGGAIKIDGTVRINTTAGAQRVFVDGGRVYIPSVRFAADDIGDLDLTNILTGSDLPLPNCDGIIEFAAGAASKKLSKKMPGGVEVELSSFSIINRADAKGLSIKGKITMGNARMGCDNVIDTSGGFDITEDPRQSLSIGVSVTNTNGFENLTFDAENISLSSWLCINEFSLNADFVNAVYALSGKVTFPAGGNDITLGAGVLFKKNPALADNKLHLDSVQASLELGECKPIGTTPLCFKGLTFSASGLAGATWNGATVRSSIIVNSLEAVILDRARWIEPIFGKPTIAEYEGTLEYRHPLVFTGTIAARHIKIDKLSASKPWQMEGVHSATLDFNNSAAVNGSMRIGHLGADDYFLACTGNMTFFWHPVIGVSATVNGLVRIPAPGPEVLDIAFIGTALRFMQLSGYIPMTLGSSAASILVNEDVGFAISTSVDVSQNPNDYVRAFGRMSLDFKYKDEVSFTTRVDTIGTYVQPVRPPDYDEQVQDAAQPVDTIVVDNTMDRVFIMVIGAGTTAAPASSVKGPDGTVYTATSTDSSVRKFSTPNGEMTQWALINPAQGNWILTLTAPKPGDEVEVTVNRKERPFTIALTSADRTATVTWDTAGSHEGDEVRIFLDADSDGYNGTYVGKSTASAGMYTYTLPATLTECAYSVYATRLASGQPIVSVYAPTAIPLTGTSGVVTPVEVTAIANQFGRTSVQWRMPIGSAVAGFLVYVSDGTGRDSVYATPFSGERFVMLDIANHLTKKIFIVAFDSNSARSCRTEAIVITTGIEDHPFVTAGGGVHVSIVPNPTNGRTFIRYEAGNDVRTSDITIDIVNIFGNSITTLSPETATTGWNQVEWDASAFPSGTYYVRITTPAGITSVPVSVIR